MGKKEESFNRRRLRLAYVSSVISITLVLLVLGMIGMILSGAGKFKDYIKENIIVQVMFDQSAEEEAVRDAAVFIESLPQIKEAKLITPDEAKEEFIREYGVDFSEVIENPLYFNMALKLKADYLHNDSIANLEALILGKYGTSIYEIHKDQVMITEVNRNLERASLVLFCISVVLAFIMVALINNTIRLAIYSKRFLIKTMQLVGATGSFIRKPFLKTGIMQGILAACIAAILLSGIIQYAQTLAPDLADVFGWESFGMVVAGIFFTGFLVTYLFTYLAVRKFLRLKVDELY